MFVLVDVCKEAWRKLRDNYRRAKQLRRTKSGQGAKNIKPIKFEKELAFLNPHLQQPPDLQITNLSMPSSEDEDTNVQNSESVSERATPDSANSVPSYLPSISKRKREPRREYVSQSPMQEYLKFKREQQLAQKSTVHPLDLFFSSIAATVKTFPVASQVAIKQQIFQLVTDTEARLVNSTSLPPTNLISAVPGPSGYAVQTNNERQHLLDLDVFQSSSQNF